jgi:NADH-quinone oxidoreductase subunit E
MTIETKEIDITTVVKEAIGLHGASREGLIPILSEINRAYGHIPAEALREVKRQMNLPENQIYVSEGQLFSIASFYHMFSTIPLGKHVVRFCESAPCHVVGGRQLLQAVMDHLQIKPNETTPGNEWSLVTTSCLGICGVGPVLLVDEDIYGNVTPEQVSEILARYS